MADVTLFHFIGILLVVTLATISERLRRGVHPFFLIIWNLPGVVLHELCHLVVGLVLFARPTGFTLWPRRQETAEGHVWTMGAVSFGRITALNAVPIALAPLLLLVAAYLLCNWWFTFFTLVGVNIIGMYGAIFFLAYNALPSWPDIRRPQLAKYTALRHDHRRTLCAADGGVEAGDWVEPLQPTVQQGAKEIVLDISDPFGQS